VWTPWRAALVGELAERLESALSEEIEGAGIAERAEACRAGALSLLAGEGDQRLSAFVARAPMRYLASHPPAEVVVDARLVAEAGSPDSAGRPRVAVSAGVAEGTFRASVASVDRPGLFASIAGALALTGLDILSADAYAATPDTALDVFIVRPDTLAEADDARWAAFERNLAAAASDPLETDSRLTARRHLYAADPHSEPIVSVEHTGAYATAVFVTAADRVGLLHDLARAIAETGLDIRWARATTHGSRVRDVFHVVDADGEPVEDPGVLGHLAMRIRERA
jgi:[protein-PII] uridylyltransferase